MAWKAMDVQDQRVRFVVAASRREKPLGALCAEFGISRHANVCRQQPIVGHALHRVRDVAALAFFTTCMGTRPPRSATPTT